MRLCDRHRTKAKHRGTEFSITWHHVYSAVVNGCCELTGIRFQKSRFKPNPYASSIDRIDATKGYVPGNVRVVIWGINAACNVWGHETYEQIAWAYFSKKLGDIGCLVEVFTNTTSLKK